MMKKIICASLLMLTSLAFAQEEKIIVIDKGSSKKYKERKEQKLIENDHVLKMSPLQMAVGEINFGFEKKINEMSSFEIELGPTLSEIGFTVQQNHYYDPWGMGTDRNTGIGFFGSVAYRYYPLDDALVLNKFYVSPVFKYRLYNFTVSDYSETLSDAKGNEGQMLFSFNFGYQKWLSEHFSLDYFVGMGLAYESHKDYNVISVYDENTGTYNYSWDLNRFNGVRYALTMGIKVGIGN